jgi:hypothetical protein
MDPTLLNLTVVVPYNGGRTTLRESGRQEVPLKQYYQGTKATKKVVATINNFCCS